MCIRDRSKEDIEQRIEVATKEILQSQYFNHMVINEDFDECLSEVKRIIASL